MHLSLRQLLQDASKVDAREKISPRIVADDFDFGPIWHGGDFSGWRRRCSRIDGDRTDDVVARHERVFCPSSASFPASIEIAIVEEAEIVSFVFGLDAVRDLLQTKDLQDEQQDVTVN